MKINISFLIILFITSCSSKNRNNIVLFNNIAFELHGSEKSLLIDSLSQHDFQSNFNNSNIQVPLFKFIKANNYSIFLGLPINISLKKLMQFKATESPSDAIIETDSISYFFIKYKNEEEHKIELIKSYDNNIIYVVASTTSEMISDSLFNKKIIFDRFNN